jgi:hypothetical protein
MQRREILEYIPITCKILEEKPDKRGEPSLRVLVKWQQVDKVNGNRRVYRRPLLEREIGRLSPMMRGGEVWGSSYHPEDGVGRVGDITHSWEKAWIDEKTGECFGEIEVLPTSNGKDLMVVLRKGKVGMSSRGRGTLTHKKDTIDGKEEEFDEVNDDYQMITPGDFVLGPSVDDAGPVRILESRLNKDLDSGESNKGEIQLEIKNVEELRKAYPELVKLAEDEAKKIAEVDLDNKIAAAIADEKDKLKEEAEDVVLEIASQREAEFINVLREIVDAISSIDGVIPEEEEADEEEEEADEEEDKANARGKKAAVKTAKIEGDAETEALKTKVKGLEDKIASDERAKQEDAKQKALKESLDKLLKDEKAAKFAPVIREEIEKDGKVDAKDEADLKAKVDAGVAKAQKIITEAKKQGIIAGGLTERGVIPNPEGGDQAVDEAQAKAKEAALEKEARAAGFRGDVKTLKG